MRDQRIDAVVEFFGPTDFFGEYAREIFEEALEGELRDLPGLEYFNETVIQPGRTRPRFPTALGCPSGPRCYFRPLETLAPDTGHAWNTSGGRGAHAPRPPHHRTYGSVSGGSPQCRSARYLPGEADKPLLPEPHWLLMASFACGLPTIRHQPRPLPPSLRARQGGTPS